MKIRIVLAFSVMMLMATIIIFGLGMLSVEDRNLKMDNETNVITVHNLDKIVELKGEWEFFPNVLLTPSEIINTEISPIYINVPGKWDSFVDATKEIQTGTYRLFLKVPKDGDYALRFNSIHFGNKVFINGEEAGGLGNPSTNFSEYKLLGKKFNAYGKSVNGEIEIVVQVANHLKFSGGIVKPVHFGTKEKIDNYTMRSIVIDSVIVVGTFLIGLLYLLRSVLKKKLSGDLFFTLYCFAQGLYFSAQNEKIILIFNPDMVYYNLWRWQFMPLNLAIIFLILFVHSIFKEYLRKKIMYFIIAINILSILLIIINNPVTAFLYNVHPLLLLITILISDFLGFVYLICAFIKGIIWKKGKVSELIISITAFICYGLSIGLRNVFEVNFGYWPMIMQMIIILSIAFSSSYHEELKNRKIANLSNEIMAHQKLKDELILKISESMKKPIKNLVEAMKSLMDGRMGPLKPDQQESVSTINLSVSTMEKLTNDLINGIHFKGRVYPVAKETILKMFNELIYEVSFFLKDSNKVNIQTNFSENIPVIYADMKLLKQAIFNILHNAAKFTEEGNITISTFEKDDFYYITIEDTGKGIDSGEIDKVFNLFYQIPDVSRNETEGLGMGLSIARQYINAMNGEIFIESEFGKGTIVTIKLPFYKEEGKILSESSQPMNYKSSNKFPIFFKGNREETVLLVDGDTEELLYLAEMLESHGYNVYGFKDDEKILEFISSNRVDIVIIDIYMTKEFIFNFIKTLRKFYQKFELPIILLSKTDRLDDAKILFEKGINAIKRWPIIEEEFISHIQSLISMKEAVNFSIKQELSAYHAQITPHFLYNTLNTIIGISYEDVEKVRNALEHLSVYFRAKLDFNKQQSLVPIEEELELVQSNVLIEKLRFQHLNVEYNIDSTIDIDIPVLTLQPLVENAIQHGLINKEQDAKIHISVQKAGDYVEIIIEDNGVGMTEEQKRSILQGQNQRLGFLNPYHKIKLMQNSRFEIESELGKGTKITIYLLNTKKSNEIDIK